MEKTDKGRRGFIGETDVRKPQAVFVADLSKLFLRFRWEVLEVELPGEEADPLEYVK